MNIALLLVIFFTVYLQLMWSSWWALGNTTADALTAKLH